MGITMLTFAEFCSRVKMRHDFADQIQVRYQHSSGEQFDTWVSGEEAQQRLKSASREAGLRALRDLDRQQLRELQQSLPGEGKQQLKDELQERIDGVISGLLGDDAAGESLSAEIDEAKRKWQTALQDDAFYAQALELAWIQLRGSLPEEEAPPEPTDWV